jgi:UDP-3-O-[3-hydroxymyristoyl] glucosamine N-acyltransferase
LAGQVGVVGHIRVGDRSRVGAQAGVARPVEPGTMVTGYPSIPHNEWLRATAVFAQLPSLLKEIRELRRRVHELENRDKP